MYTSNIRQKVMRTNTGLVDMTGVEIVKIGVNSVRISGWTQTMLSDIL